MVGEDLLHEQDLLWTCIFLFIYRSSS